MIAKLREIATAIRLASMETDDDDEEEEEGEPKAEKPKSPRLLSPISNTLPPLRRGSARKRGGPRDKNRDTNNDDDDEDDGDDDDEDEDDDADPNERSVRSEYVSNTDDLLAVAERLSRLYAP